MKYGDVRKFIFKEHNFELIVHDYVDLLTALHVT